MGSTSIADFLRLRFASHRLNGSDGTDPTELVASMGAVQSQDYRASLWAIGVRLPRATPANVERALSRGELVRTRPMRGTLHTVAAADVRWMLALMAHRQDAGARRRGEILGLDDSHVARAGELTTAALAGGHARTRADLYARFEAHGIDTGESRGLHLLGCLARGGVVCLGPRQDKQPTYVLLDEWVPANERDGWDAERSLEEIARRYIGSHGPATDRDLAMWTGLPLRAARAGLAASAATLSTIDVEGTTYWHASDLEPQQLKTVLLPAFDEYLLGYADRSHIAPAGSASITATTNGIFHPVVLQRGIVSGQWNPGTGPDTPAVELHPYPGIDLRDTTAAERAYVRFEGPSAGVRARRANPPRATRASGRRSPPPT